jgi:hypothetical protein
MASSLAATPISHMGGLPCPCPIIVSVISIAGALLCIGYLYGRAAMKRHCWETAAIISVVFATVMLLVYGTQLAWEVVRSSYDDHGALVRRLGELQKYAKDKQKFDDELRWAKGETQHWQDA